jgi:hypothetical protein
MATGFTDFLSGKVIDHIFRNQAYTVPTTVYVGLYTTMPTRSTAGTEVSGGSYARVAVTFSAASSGTSANSGTLTWPAATADWGTVLGVCISDASTAGNQLWYGTLTASRNITNGTTFSIATSALTLDPGQ